MSEELSCVGFGVRDRNRGPALTLRILTVVNYASNITFDMAPQDQIGTVRQLRKGRGQLHAMIIAYRENLRQELSDVRLAGGAADRPATRRQSR